MNIQAFDTGKRAYQQGDWESAVQNLSAAKQASEVSGEIDHLLGNSLMKLGRFDEAAQAYENALLDAEYAKVGPLQCNRGRALVVAGRNEEAVAALNAALADTSYPTPYKAYMSLGKAYTALGDARQAGVAFRNAAIDETNPSPSRSLTSLGECFMQLSRPLDAIEAYRTALDFFAPEEDQSSVYALLGDAYSAANRTHEAIDAYTRAQSAGYQLSPTQRASYEAAQLGVAAVAQRTASETDDLLRAAGYGQNPYGTYDPLDPLGKSGEFMPSPEDTGFFTVSEQELMLQDSATHGRKRKGHKALRFFLVLLILLLLLSAVAGFAYYRGYGWPTQQAVVEGLFSSTSDSIGSYLDSSVSSTTRREIELLLPDDATIEVEGIDRDMSSSTLLVVATLSSGGEQTYQVEMVRDGITWKVTSVELVYGSIDESSTASLLSTSTSSSSVTTTSEGTSS